MAEALGALRRDRRAAGAHPGEQPQGRRGLLPRARPDRRRGRAAQHRQARQDRRRTPSPALLVAEAGADEPGARVPRARRDQRVRRVRHRPRARRCAGESNELLDEGLAELGALIRAAAVRAPGVVVADLKIARGLDYYTGSVYETVLVGHEQLGSICSGGRYDTLASDGANTYPGRRAVDRRLPPGVAPAQRGPGHHHAVGAQRGARRGQQRGRPRAGPTPSRPRCGPGASRSRSRRRRRSSASRSGTPTGGGSRSCGSCGEDEQSADQVKDIRSGEQVDADAATWTPDDADLWPRVVPA